MQTLRMTSHVGADGLLRLEVPIGRSDTDVNVLLIIESESAKSGAWPDGFIDRTAGAWQDDPVVRESQSPYDVRAELR
jgi:hypothetical protein